MALALAVMAVMPRLEAELAGLPPTLLAGEVGAVPATSRMACSRQQQLGVSEADGEPHPRPSPAAFH